MVRKVNLALLGSGYWGSKLASEYIDLHKENQNFNFIGIIDPDKKRLAAEGNIFCTPFANGWQDDATSVTLADIAPMLRDTLLVEQRAT